jgi:hypothetical protein
MWSTSRSILIHGQGIQMQNLARLLCAEVFNSWSGKRLLINGFLLEMSPWCRGYVVFVQLQIAWSPSMQPNISFKSVELRQSPWSSFYFYLSSVLQFSSWLPTMIKQQEINIVPSDSASLVTLDEPLDGIMGFTKSSTKFYLVMQKFSDVLLTNIVNPHLIFWDPGGATYFLDMGKRYIVNRLVFLWLYQNVWIASVGQIKPESKVEVKAIGRMTLQLQFYHQALDDP